ncbi:substrate-binding periplasmic protein [Flavobacterium sp. W21_SRS_FM6]|uniref:substrate-binding periplasmic protein n=1 Tax=Flavobacterium sp. W21_SRS_FM6 TaxID=3240268 RepID=UPI003F8F3FCF
MRNYLPISYAIFALFLAFLSKHVLAQEVKPAKLDWCFDNINGAHQMLGSPPKPSGKSVELMQYLATEVGFEIRHLAPIPSARCLLLIQKGEVDIMTNLVYHPALAKSLYLYQYLKNQNAIKFVVLADSNYTIDSVDALMALDFALVRGYAYGDRLEDIFKKTNGSSTFFVNSAEVALNLLKTRRVDGVLLPLSNTSNIEQQNQEQHLFRHLDLPDELNPVGAVYVGLSKKSQYTHLGPAIESALNKAVKNGFIETLLTKNRASGP